MANVFVVFVVNVSESALSSFTTRVPTRPVVVTLRLKLDTHVAVTVVFAVIVPVALLLRVQVWLEG